MENLYEKYRPKELSEIVGQESAVAAILLCDWYGKGYYIKDDLKPYLNGIEYTNMDTRIVTRR